MSKISINRPVTTVMIICIVLGLGVLSLFNLQLDSMPNMNIPNAMVSTSYPGAGPEEVLELVTKPIENALSTIAGLKTISSNSSAGRSQVNLEFETDVDIDKAVQSMSEAVNRLVSRLPKEVSTPTVRKMSMNSASIMSISVTSDVMSVIDLKSLVDDQLTDRLQKQQGVAAVDVQGGRQREIAVEILEDKAAGYGITMQAITQLLSSENQDGAGGSVREGTRAINVKTKGMLKTVDDIKNLTISTSSGAKILLQDVANIYEKYVDVTSYSYIDGKPNISMQVTKQSTANTVSVSDLLTKEVKNIQTEYPDIAFKITSDAARDVRDSVSAVASSAMYGMALAVMVLYIFLRNIKSTLVVAAAIPISIVSTFFLMKYTNITLNTMSLSGLMLGVGMLVDNSIVVIESIFRRMESGESRKEAALNGAREVSMSITASTLTTVAVFLPVTFLGGLTAQYFNDLAFTICFALLSSLLVALTFVPMASSLILSPITKRKFILTRAFSAVVGGILDGITAAYRFVLRGSLKLRFITVVVAGIFFAASMTSMSKIGRTLMTYGTTNNVNLSLSLPEGTVLEETVKVADEATLRLKPFADVIDSTTLRINGTSVNYSLTLTDPTTRTKDNATVTREIRDAMASMAGVSSSTQARRFGGGSGNDVTLEIKGQELETLQQIGNDFVALLKGIPGVVEPRSSVTNTVEEAVVIINRAKAAKYGISSQNVTTLIYQTINGSTATSIKTGGTTINVNVKYNADKAKYLSDLNNLMIRTSTGAYIPLSEIAEIQKAKQARSINRTNLETYVTVTATLENLDTGTASTLIEQAIAEQYVMPHNYKWDFGGNQRTMFLTFDTLKYALIMALFLVYAIMASEFESLYYPFIIMFSIPVALSSGLLGLYLTKTQLSITAYLGLITLSGVVINNAIVLIDYINILRRERGYELRAAVEEAGPIRLRAVLMSASTTVLGLVPMMASKSQASMSMQPLAVVIVFGLSISTFVTLLLIPSLYLIFEGFRGGIAKVLLRGRK